MKTIIWDATVDEEHHQVELDYGSFWGNGRVTLDDRLIDAWEIMFWTKTVRFDISGKSALLRVISPLVSIRAELYVDGYPVDRAKR